MSSVSAHGDAHKRINSSDVEEFYEEGLIAAAQYKAGSHFAHVRTFVRPFTRQLKLETRDRFPYDTDAFDDADALQEKARRAYGGLRIATAALFAFFLAASLILLRSPYFAENQLSKAWGGWGAVALVGAIGLTLFLLRTGLRRNMLDLRVTKYVDDLAHHVSSKLKNLIADTNFATMEIEDRVNKRIKRDWPEKAMGWCRIALWCAARGNALDSYATTVFWKIEVSDTDTERAWRLVKGLLLLVALFVLFRWRPAGAALSVANASSPLAAVGGWLLAWYYLFVRLGHENKSRRVTGMIVWAVIFAALVAYWHFQRQTDAVEPKTLVVGLLFVLFFWFGWMIHDERSDDLWTERFSEELAKGETARVNTAYYFDSISNHVGNLAQQIMEILRIQGQGNSDGRPLATQPPGS